MDRPSATPTGFITVVYVLALALWAGGLVVLGAVVAPTVFRNVPAPTSADAMILVFRRFDRIAIGCAAVALVAEAALAWRGGKPAVVDLVRAGIAVVAGGLAIAGGAYFSPSIEALHRGGAVRGFGDAGVELERLHHLAETVAKAELLAIVVVLVLVVLRQGRARV